MRKLTPEEEEKFKKKQEEILNSPSMVHLRKTLLDYNEQMNKVFKPLLPTFNKIAELQNNMKKAMREQNKLTNYYIPYFRPVEYRILDELQKLNSKKSTQKKSANNEFVIEYNTQDDSLNRLIDGKIFSYNLAEDGKRKKLLNTLIQKEIYIKTNDLRIILSCPSNSAVSKMVQTFNSFAGHSLRLKSIKIIQGKKGSGYRINPNLRIERVNS